MDVLQSMVPQVTRIWTSTSSAELGASRSYDIYRTSAHIHTYVLGHFGADVRQNEKEECSKKVLTLRVYQRMVYEYFYTNILNFIFIFISSSSKVYLQSVRRKS